MKTIPVILSFLLTGTLAAGAKVVPSSLIGDHMVLQQNTNARIYGTADPGSAITVTPSWNGKHYTATTDRTGSWSLAVETPEGSFTPYSITISDGDPVTFSDVLVGEVWLASGQSNMEMPLKGFPGCCVEGGYDEIQQRYQEAVRQYDALKQSYDTFLTGLSSSADAQIQKSSQNLADKGKARFITGLIIAGALFLFLFAPLGICLLAVGIVWAVIYTRNQKSSAQNLAQSYPEFQKIQQDFKEAEQKMMYYKELTEKIKMVENYEKLHRIS